MITRWGTWLRAALYYNEYFPVIRTIVNTGTGGEFLVDRAKKAINVNNLVQDLVRINQHRTPAAKDKLFEASECTMTEA